MTRFHLDKNHLPILGIIAFSLCSVWSLYHLFVSNAQHPTPLFWIPATLTELVTAWAVHSLAEYIRRLTRSNISNQDRRFYRIVVIFFGVVAMPTLAVSVWANSIEFGSILLGSLFPIASITCAVGSALPKVVTKHERQRQEEATKAQAERKARQAERKKEQERRKKLASLGKARATFEQLVANPEQSQASIAQALSITRQAVGNHMAKLEQAGAIRRNNGESVEVLWEV